MNTLLALAPFLLPVQDSEPAKPEAPGVRVNDKRALQGYTMLEILSSTRTVLVDMQGEIVHTWTSEHQAGNSSYLLDNGHLLRTCRLDGSKMSGGGQGGAVQEFDWDGNLLWTYTLCDDQMRHHHDIKPLPNGNVLLIAWEDVPPEDAIAAGRDPEHIGERGFWPDVVVEVEPTRPEGGRIVWEWHAFDHVIQDFDPERAGYGDVTAHPERIDINWDHRDSPPLTPEQQKLQEEMEKQMRELGYAGDDEEEEEEEEGANRGGRDGRSRKPGDWMHTNGIDYVAEYDLIVISVRSASEFWVIDHSTTTAQAGSREGGRYGRGGDLLYRWGNPKNYGLGKASDRRLFGQHDSQFVLGENGNLSVTVFNNGSGRGEPYSSADEVLLPFDPEHGFHRADGKAFGPVDATWSYSAPEEGFYGSFISGAQRLPNGNTLICSGPQARIFEVTRDGDVVWDFKNPHRGDRGGRGDGGAGGPAGRPGGAAGGEGRGGPPPAGIQRVPGGGGGRGGPATEPGACNRAHRIPTDHPALVHLER